MVGFSVYSLQAEWPVFFRFALAFFVFVAVRLVVKVYTSNRRPAAVPAASVAGATTAVAGEATKAAAAAEESKKTK